MEGGEVRLYLLRLRQWRSSHTNRSELFGNPNIRWAKRGDDPVEERWSRNASNALAKATNEQLSRSGGSKGSI